MCDLQDKAPGNVVAYYSKSSYVLGAFYSGLPGLLSLAQAMHTEKKKGLPQWHQDYPYLQQ